MNKSLLSYFVKRHYNGSNFFETLCQKYLLYLSSIYVNKYFGEKFCTYSFDDSTDNQNVLEEVMDPVFCPFLYCVLFIHSVL